jgi:hypothetical protein
VSRERGTHGREKCERLFRESPKERDHWEDRGVNGRMGSKEILGRVAGRMWSEFTWLRKGISRGSFQHGSEISGSGARALGS